MVLCIQPACEFDKSRRVTNDYGTTRYPYLFFRKPSHEEATVEYCKFDFRAGTSLIALKHRTAE